MTKFTTNSLEHKRLSILKTINKPESLFSRSKLANIIILAFCAADAFTLYTVFNQILSENPVMLVLILTGFVLCLDVTMGVAGNVLKQCQQGLRSKKETGIIVTICVCSFLIAFGLFFGLRIATRDSLGSNDTINDAVAKAVEAFTDTDNLDMENIIKWFAAFALGLIPLATSLASLGVSLTVSNPIKERLIDCEKAKIKLQSYIASVEQVLSETEDPEAYKERMMSREDEVYTAFKDEVDKSATTLKLKVRTMLMEKLDNPDQITSLTDSSKEVLNPNAADTTESTTIHETSNHFIA